MIVDHVPSDTPVEVQPAPVSAPVATPAVQPAAPTPEFSWKQNLTPDYANSPTIKKYADTKDGLNDAIRSTLDLTQMLGNEKVVIPKSKDDVKAWELYAKAMGIPEKAEGYQLEDAKLPDSIKELSLNKNQFAEIVHANKLTPDQAKALWNSYTQLTAQAYEGAMTAHKEKMTQTINALRAEWGDAYQSKVELGQLVINKFSDNDAMKDYVTATLSSDPNGIKFLAKIGDQFAENKIGDFQYQRHSLTAEEAQGEIDKIRQNAAHPYNNDRATPAERNRAIDHMNDLISEYQQYQDATGDEGNAEEAN